MKTYFKRRIDVASPQQSSKFGQIYGRLPKCTPLLANLGLSVSFDHRSFDTEAAHFVKYGAFSAL